MLMWGCMVWRMWIVLSLRWEVSMRLPMLVTVANALTLLTKGPANDCCFFSRLYCFLASSRVRLLLICFWFLTHDGLAFNVTPGWYPMFRPLLGILTVATPCWLVVTNLFILRVDGSIFFSGDCSYYVLSSAFAVRLVSCPPEFFYSENVKLLNSLFSKSGGW